tara:strand:+ start:9123 stop:10229 length:1107 start_codon:yes stop_codon:yes gene_type:complete
MINPILFKKTLNNNGFEFFTGVPDSVLKHFTNTLEEDENIIAVSEGSALTISIGYYISKNKIPVVYLQNSGLGNIVNPYLSISSPKAYDFPVLFIIGWRGNPEIKDEPQHIHQGLISKDLLELMGIKTFEINDENFQSIIEKAKSSILEGENAAILVNIGQFENYETKNISKKKSIESLDAIAYFKKKYPKNLFVASTGMIGRELYTITEELNLESKNNFLNPGGMGHTMPLAASISKFSNKNIICIDGDGSLLMHMGNLHSTINVIAPKGFNYILINNNSHDSVGGQTTKAFNLNFKLIALGIGFEKYLKIESIKELDDFVLEKETNQFIEIIVSNRSNKKLLRPSESFAELKNIFKQNFEEKTDNS